MEHIKAMNHSFEKTRGTEIINLSILDLRKFDVVRFNTSVEECEGLLSYNNSSDFTHSFNAAPLAAEY